MKKDKHVLVELLLVEEDVPVVVVVPQTAQESLGRLVRPARLARRVWHDDGLEVGLRGGEESLELLGGRVHCLLQVVWLKEVR